MLTLVSCNDADKDALTLATDTAGLANVDGDGDGFFAADDCNDADASIGPGSIEVCDGVDNNCDGLIDEGVLTISFADTDGDGYGNPEQPLEACGTADGAAPNANDCDDTNGAVFPGAAETCNDIDDDCDDEVDEGVTVTAYTDADGDGFGDSTTGVEVCEASAGQVLVAEDCDDNDPDAWPDNPEFCDEADNNCDGEIDEGVTVTYYRDDDGDGWGGFSGTAEACTVPDGYAAEAGDCDDSDTAYHPGATEDDCTDPNDYNCDGSVAYADADADGWPACEDCDDTQASVNPDSLEICNAIDDDCDGNIDDDDPDVDLSTGTTWYADADTDGYGDRSVTTLSCAVPSGFVADNTDCDDDATAVHPGATEVCDTIDNDCDGDIDDADSSLDTSTGVSFYIDSDTDGYGDPASSVMACEAPSGTVNSDADCDDGDATINPAATEVCDSVDNDCDGDIDDDDIDVTGQPTWYVDTDVDGYGSPTTTTQACVQPSGYVNSMSDCDDGDRSINPAASEVCDSIDNDCDGYIDDDDSSLDASTGSSFYRDSDADGYGSSASGTIYACSVASGYSTTSSDCDDGDSSTYPGASEACDGEDNDCDGSADNGATCSYQLVGSGGGSLCVDDDLYVNQNGSRIYTDSTWGAQCGHVVSFTGSPGDTLYMWAVDSVGGCRNMSDVYIKLVATGQIQYLASGYSNTCGHGASSSAFWSRSVSVPGAF